MLLSAVRSTSKPALSASTNRSPLVSVSHPRSLAFVTVWPERNRAMPLGVTWSKRMSIHREICGRSRDRIKAAGGKFKYRVDLFPRDVELLNDFFYGGPGFEIFEHGRNRHTDVLEHPCAAESSRHAFNGRTLPRAPGSRPSFGR